MNLIGKTLRNQFKVETFIASGGMGTVYKAWDNKRNVYLAMKVLHTDLAEDPSIFKRFQREARALERLTHPNIVPFYGIFKEQGFAYLLEQYIDGPSLKEILRQKKQLSTQNILSLVKALSAALGYAHANGVVHCDIKPGNIMIDSGGNIYLTDFGIARHADSTTTTLASAGTPAYMAPEQIRGDSVSPATDIYALGVMVFELITGQRPFQGTDAESSKGGSTAYERIRYAHLNLEPPDPVVINPDLPEKVSAVINRALTKKPQDRYQSTRDFYYSLCEALGFNPTEITDRVNLNSDKINVQAETGFLTNERIRKIEPNLFMQYWYLWAVGVAVLLILFYLFWPDEGVFPFHLEHKPTPTIINLTFDLTSTQENLILTRTQPVASTETQLASINTLSIDPVSTHAAETVIARLTHSAVTLSHAPVTRSTVTPKPQTPTSANPTGLIAFNSDRAGNNDIYVMNADGSKVTQLTTGTFDERVPAWSPDGKNIAYQSNDGGDYEIVVINLENRQIRQVTNNSCDDYNPVWSSDGQRFAFYSDCDGNREIYTIGIDGSGRRQLTKTTGVYNWFPNWSPDSRQIVFASNRGGKYQVWIMNEDGSDEQALAPGCLASFSPDGEWLVFTEYCSDLGALFLMRPDGSQLQVLDEQYNSTNPSWSPDGKWILFQSDRSGNEEIWAMDVYGTDSLQLTDNAARDSAPVWQPGGTAGSP